MIISIHPCFFQNSGGARKAGIAGARCIQQWRKGALMTASLLSQQSADERNHRQAQEDVEEDRGDPDSACGDTAKAPASVKNTVLPVGITGNEALPGDKACKPLR